MGSKSCNAALCSCVLVVLLAGAIVGLIALGKSFVEVPPGQVGVVVTRGNLRTVGPGRHQVRPFASNVNMMSTKTQLLEQGHTIPTKEGLNVKLDTAMEVDQRSQYALSSYHLDAEKAEEVYKGVGMNYEDVLIKPDVASIIRSLTVVSEAKALYTDGREAIQSQMKERLENSLRPRGIVVEKVFLKGIELPPQLQTSIELKAKAEQDAERIEYELEKDKKKAEQAAALMEYTLERERQEAARKAIEASGIADFQRIVSEGISEHLLKWKGIEATERLADSDNAKMVIMGGGGGGLPVILDGLEGMEGAKHATNDTGGIDGTEGSTQATNNTNSEA